MTSSKKIYYILALLASLSAPYATSTENPYKEREYLFSKDAVNSVYPWLKTRGQIKALVERGRLGGDRLIDESPHHLIYSESLDTGVKLNDLYRFNVKDQLCEIRVIIEATGSNLQQYSGHLASIGHATGVKPYVNTLYKNNKALELYKNNPDLTPVGVKNNEMMIGAEFHADGYRYNSLFMSTEQFKRDLPMYGFDLTKPSVITTTSINKECKE